MTVLSALFMNLNPLNRKGRLPVELDSVPGLDWNELFDMNGFSELHKIVYGVSSRPLDAEIDARPEDLDRPDSNGLTALWWACWLGNSNHIRILIQHGADVNNSDSNQIRVLTQHGAYLNNNTGIPLLCAAVCSGSYDSVEQLLNAGASIADSAIDLLYDTLLLEVPWGVEHLKEVLAIDKALFGRSLGVNCRSPMTRATPLMDLAMRGPRPRSDARMRQLLEFGADTELADERGRTALCRAIYSGNAESCEILGRAGANTNVKTNRGNTIIHLAIRKATDASIIQAVSELDLSGVELGAKDNWGCTAFELLKIRAGRHRNDQHLFPAVYCYDLDHDHSRWYGDLNWDCFVKNIDTELQILLSFQTLLQKIQEAQAISI